MQGTLFMHAAGHKKQLTLSGAAGQPFEGSSL